MRRRSPEEASKCNRSNRKKVQKIDSMDSYKSISFSIESMYEKKVPAS